MSNDDTLTFPCPACQSTLKVPAQLAGVQGPCPQCGTDIVAPNPALRTAARMAAAPQLAGVGVGAGHSVSPPPEFPPPAVDPAGPESNPWGTSEVSPPDSTGSDDLNLGPALLGQPVNRAPVSTPLPEQASPAAQEAPHPWAAQPAQMTQGAQPAFPTPDAGQNPFPKAAQPESLPAMDPFAANPERATASESTMPGFPTAALFPTKGVQNGTSEQRTEPTRKPTKAKSSPKRAKARPGSDSPSPLVKVLVGGGAVAAIAAGIVFLTPGLKDKIFGDSDGVAVSVDTVEPVKRDPSSLPAPTPPTGDGTVIPVLAPPSAVPTVPAPGLNPIPTDTPPTTPDFGLGDAPPAGTGTTDPVDGDAAQAALPAAAIPGAMPLPGAKPVDNQAADGIATPEDVAAARAVLESFLAAQTIEERLAHAQPATQVEQQMRDYYAKHPNLPVVDQIKYTLANVLEGSTHRFFIFEITTNQQQQGFPVAVEETDDGMRVDWRSFVEFHDNMLGKFIGIYQPGADSFRVILDRAHYFKSDIPDLGSKLAFRIRPPIPGFEGYAFCSKDTVIGQELDRKFAWDVKYLPIVELAWKKEEDGSKYIQIVRVVQDNWRAMQ